MKKVLFTLLALSLLSTANAQFAGCDPYLGVDAAGRKCGGTIQTAVPFLMINPDARSGAMGDVGIAISPDANAIHFNASKMELR